MTVCVGRRRCQPAGLGAWVTEAGCTEARMQLAAWQGNGHAEHSEGLCGKGATAPAAQAGDGGGGSGWEALLGGSGDDATAVALAAALQLCLAASTVRGCGAAAAGEVPRGPAGGADGRGGR